MRAAILNTLQFLAFSAISGSQVSAQHAKNELVDIAESTEWKACENLPTHRQVRDCWNDLVGERRWKLTVYHAPGITGANSTYIPDATDVLTRIVEDCGLGSAILVYHTDGVASVFIGEPDLDGRRIACVERFERPGLFLSEHND